MRQEISFFSDSTTHTKETCEKDEMAIFCDPPYIVEIKYAFWGVYANLNACDTKYDGPGKCNDPNSKNVSVDWFINPLH